MARKTAPPDAELVELPGVIHISTLEIPGSTVQTFLTRHHDQQDIPKEELEGHNSDPIQQGTTPSIIQTRNTQSFIIQPYS